MWNIVKSLLVAASVAAGMNAAMAAAATSPLVGTWNLNVTQSTFILGQAPRKKTRIYTQSAEGLVSTINTTAADGRETTSANTLRVDGKLRPYSGSAAYDMISLKQVDANTREFATMRGSTSVGSGQTQVSTDGRTLIVKYKGVTETGAKADSIEVYDRQ